MSDSVRPHRRQATRLPQPWDSPGKSTGVGCHFLLQCMKMKSEREVAQSCPTLSDPTDCSLPGSSIHGIFQARVLEWGAIAFSVLVLGKPLNMYRRHKMIYIAATAINFIYFKLWGEGASFASLRILLHNQSRSSNRLPCLNISLCYKVLKAEPCP